MSQSIQEALSNMFTRVEKIYSLASEDLLEISFFGETKHGIEDDLKALSPELDELSQLRIKKTIPMWRSVYKTGGFMNGQQAIREIDSLRELIIQLQAKYSENGSVPITTDEILVPSGKPYEGRKRLRSIFDQAKTSILIRDNYLKPAILDVLSEYVSDKPELNVRILVGDNGKLTATSAHYKIFNIQFPNAVKIKFVPKEQQDHPRYVLIDETTLFNPDHSLDQWGVSTVNIRKVTDPTNLEKIKTNLEEEWASASELT